MCEEEVGASATVYLLKLEDSYQDELYYRHKVGGTSLSYSLVTTCTSDLIVIPRLYLPPTL